MKTLGTFILGAGVVLGSSLPAMRVRGEYVEARTADVWTGPCFANSEVGLTGNLAVMGWKVESGTFEGVPLDGLSVVGVVEARHTLGDVFETAYPVKSVIILDEKATAAQRLALQKFAQRMSGDLLTDVVRIFVSPISLTFDGNVHQSKARLVAGNLAAIETRALEERDAICHSNEAVWYEPLSKLGHAMPAFAITHRYSGSGLSSTWSSPNKRSAFVGTFDYGN